MKRHTFATYTTVLAAASLIAFSGSALAGPGMGMGMGAGHAGHGGMKGGMRGGWMANLSQEQIAQLDAERQAFWTATADLRQQIRQKNLEQRAELAKKEPDVSRIKALQQELSALGTQLDQKEIEHVLAMKKIAPEAAMGMACPGAMGGPHGGGRGMGMGRGMMMGMDCPRMGSASNPPTN